MKIKQKDINYYADKIKKQLHTGQVSAVYLLKDGRILKIFYDYAIPFFKQTGYDIEKKIKESFQYELNPKIKRPQEIIYKNGRFCGYIMERAKGIDFNKYEENLSIKERTDLNKYAVLYNNLEKVVKDSKKIVIPDLLTCDNIYVDNNLGIELIDFDGFQIGNNPTPVISSSLGNQTKIAASRKYYNPQTMLFTKELDIKSLIHLYFLDTFNIDINKLGMINPGTGSAVTLDDLFEIINLDDYDVMNKVWLLFQEKRANEYLGDSVFDIAENYTMEAIPNPMLRNTYLKRLKRR